MGEDEDRIRRTLSEYSQHFDDGHLDAWADLFTEDARFVVSGKVIEGRAAIRGYMASVHAAGGRGMHVTTNSLVDVDRDGGTAAASTDYLYVRPSGDGVAIIAAGRYHDRLIRDGTAWRFRERTISMLTAAPPASDG